MRRRKTTEQVMDDTLKRAFSMPDTPSDEPFTQLLDALRQKLGEGDGEERGETRGSAA